MNIKNILELSFINFKTNKFKNRIYILIFTIIMTLIICVFSGRNSLMKYNNDFLNKSFYHRMIGVQTDNYNNDELKDTLEKMNIKHIKKIFKDNQTFYQVTRFEDKGYVELYGNYDGLNYIIDSGRNIENDNEIICPSVMYPGNWTTNHNIEEYINMKDKIGEKIKISYDKYYVIDDDNREIIDNYEYELELVGTFDVDENLLLYNMCFTSINFFEKVVDEKKSIHKDKNYVNIYEYEVYVLVDEYKNVDYVMNILEDAGYELQLYAELDLDFFNDIVALIDKVSIYVLGATFICICLFINNTLQENKKNIALYELLGYEKKDIRIIYFYYYLINTFISFIISLILSYIIRFIILYIFSYKRIPNFSFLNIYIFYKEILLYILFIIIVIFISLFILFKIKYKKYSPIMLMEDRI